jgi:hypothetical protein
MTELDLAITFCRISRSTQNSDTALRNANHAKEAYGEAERRFKESNLSREMNLEISAQLEQLAPLLAKLPHGL